MIFDMDGVIFDSETLVIRTWKQVADKYGIPDVEKVCMQCLGTNHEATVKIFQKHYGQDFPYEIYKKEMAALFHEQAADGRLPKKRGVCELLEFLKTSGIKTGLATSTREEVVKRELSEGGLLQYFDVIVCGDMVKRSKPEPDIYLEAARKMNCRPDEALVVEDALHAIETAKKAGFSTAAVYDKANKEQEKIRETADIYLKSFDEQLTEMITGRM